MQALFNLRDNRTSNDPDLNLLGGGTRTNWSDRLGYHTQWERLFRVGYRVWAGLGPTLSYIVNWLGVFSYFWAIFSQTGLKWPRTTDVFSSTPT